MSKNGHITIDAISQKAMYNDHEALKTLLDELNATLPRSLRINALREVLDSHFEKELYDLENLENPESKETKRLEFLRSASVQSETQLIDALSYYNSQTLNKAYMEALWKRILTHLMETYDVPLSFFNTFFEHYNEENSDVELPHHEFFNEAIDELFHDQNGNCDGLAFETLRNALYNHGTKDLLIRIGAKYGLEITKTMNKEQMRKRIKAILDAQGRLDASLVPKIDEGSIKELEEMATSFKLPVRSYLTKEDMIDQLIIHVSKIQEEDTKKDEQETFAQAIERLEEEIKEIRELLASQTKRRREAESQQTSANQKSPRRFMVLDVFAAVLIGYLFIGLIGYFLDGTTIFTTINDLFNRVTYRGYGLMELYHNVLDFIIRG